MMKPLFFILFSLTTFAQSPFFLLFDEVASTPAPSEPNNIFVFTEGNALSQEDMETALGISLTNFSTSGDTVYFDDIDYAVPEDAFYDNANLVYLKTSADTIYASAFSGTFQVTKVVTPRCKYYGDYAFYNNISIDSIYAPNLKYWGNTVLSDEGYPPEGTEYLILDSLTHLGADPFRGSIGLTHASLKSLETVPASTFYGCTALEYIDLRSCTNLGGTTGDDGVFNGIEFQTITLIVPVSLMTCNEINPDDDILVLQANNAVTIINP